MGARDGQHETYSRDISKIKTCNDQSSSLDNDYGTLREVENGRRGNNNYDPSIGQKDGEMDIYSFSFLNHSGSFCFPFEGSQVSVAAPTTGLFIPANGMKVVNRNQPDLLLELVDENGILYKFEVKDVDDNKGYKEYYLTQVVSADKSETIDFTYDVISATSIYIPRPYINYKGILTTTTPIASDAGSITQNSFTDNGGGIYYQNLRPPRLTRIDFTDGYITFDYTEVNNVKTWDLYKINIYNNVQSSPLQTISLTKGQFSNGEKRLDKVIFGDPQGQSYDYQFGYNGDPGDIHAPGGIMKGIDYWGYFNGSSVPDGRCYMPSFDNMSSLMPKGTDRAANDYYMQRGILNKITYPTKGYSEFVYEAHRARFSLGTELTTFGGLRIREIRSFLPDGSLTEKKWYVYGEDESGIGIANKYPDISDFTVESRILITHARVINNDVLDPHLCQMRTIKSYSSFPKINYFLSGSSVVYSQVTEYTGSEIKVNGKITNVDNGRTIYRYEVFPDEKIPQYGDTYRWNSPDAYLRTYSWKTGNLLSKEVYRKDENSYKKVYSLENIYKNINEFEFRNVRVLPCVEFEYNWEGSANYTKPDIKSGFCSYQNYRNYFGGSSPSLCPYDYFNYYTTTGLRVLESTQEVTDGIATYTTYDSYNKNGLPTSISRTASTGDVATTKLSYPTEFSFAPYNYMQESNILTPVIEKRTYKNNELLKREITEYKSWHSLFYAPLNYKEGYREESPEIRLTYSYDTKANIQEIVKDGETKNVYLWGYNQTYPVARLDNSTYETVTANNTLMSYINQLENYSNFENATDRANLKKLNTNIRNNIPTGSLITTYTYKPLVGITSETDVNGTTTYYEYDDLGRLKYIKDNEENILKKYEYHYKK
jgi:YD repeat-containing protein